MPNNSDRVLTIAQRLALIQLHQQGPRPARDSGEIRDLKEWGLIEPDEWGNVQITQAGIAEIPDAE